MSGLGVGGGGWDWRELPAGGIRASQGTFSSMYMGCYKNNNTTFVFQTNKQLNIFLQLKNNHFMVHSFPTRQIIKVFELRYVLKLIK